MKKRVAKVMALFLAVCMVLLSPASVMAADGGNTNAGFYSGQQDDIETSKLQEGDGEVIGQVSPDGLEGITETSEQRDEGEVLGTDEIPDITASPETMQEQTMTETQKEEVSKPENEQSSEIQETAEEAEVLQSDEKETKTREAVNGVMVIDISEGLVVITNEGFAQEKNDYFNPIYDEIPNLPSFTSWTGPYRITGRYERPQDGITSSDPIIKVLGGSVENPIQIELNSANLNNKKDNNVMSSGAAMLIGDFVLLSSGARKWIYAAVDLNLTGTNTTIGSRLHSGVQVSAESWLRISGEGSLDAVGGDGAAGIGGMSQSENGSGRTIIIDSGTINATGGEHGAGIGGGRNTVGGTIEINGGNITATGGLYGAGIGGGVVYYDSDMPPLDIRINGGTVQSTGGALGAGIGGGYAEKGYKAASEISIQIGGTADVTAVGGKLSDWFGGAGIGTAYVNQSESEKANPNTLVKKIEISGGTVYATGTDCAAGIGTSPGGHVENIVISDGEVTALGGVFATGIGTGYSWPQFPQKSTVDKIQISGGTVQATGMDNSAGIGSADYSTMGDIAIEGGDIQAQGGSFGSGIGSGARAAVGDITVTAGKVVSRGGANGAGIGTGWSGTAKTILISGGNVSASTDFTPAEGDEADGFGAGIGGGADGTVEAIKMSGTAEILAVSGLEAAGIGRGFRESIEVPVIPITIEGTPKITAYATGTLDGNTPSKEISAVEYEGITSCSINMLQGHFKTVLDSQNEKPFVVREDIGAEYALNMPKNFQSFAVTTNETGIHKVYVDDVLYTGSTEMSEDVLTSRLQVNGQSVNPYWYLQPAEMFTVTFDSQGGTPVEAIQTAGGETIAKPEDPTREGYMFQGWYKELTTENAWDFTADIVNCDLTLYAGWKPIQYDVIFDKNADAAEGTMENQHFKYDEEKKLNENIFKYEGYEFAGWAAKPDSNVTYIDMQSVKNLTTENDGKVYLYAVWNEIGDAEYTIEHYKQSKDGMWPEKASDTEVKSAKPGIEVNATPKVYDGYTFDSTVEGTVSSGAVAKDGSLVLKLYYKVRHNVTFNSDGGSYTPDNQSVIHGEKAVSPENPIKEGYIFEGWYYKIQDESEEKWDFDNAVTGDLRLSAHWIKTEEPETPSHPYTIEHYKQEKDGIWPEKASDMEVKSAKPGTKVSGQAKTYDGYVFDPTVEGTVSSGIVTEDGKLVLKLYYKICHTVTFDSDGGNYTPSNQSVVHGNKADSPENPSKNGYVFEGWYYKNLKGEEEKWNFDNIVTGDLQLTAHWKKSDNSVTPPKPSNPSNGGHINSGSINNSGNGSSVARTVKTGDTSNLVLLFTLLGGSAVVLLTVIIIRKRRDKRQ